jgi:tRNA-Thr(GGU) m(6)t(6)A37 methyltransferase TsaA
MVQSNELLYIGQITSPYTELAQCPNNVDFNGPEFILKLDKEFEAGIDGLKQGDHILLLYWLEQANRSLLTQTRRDGNDTIGTFALRSPHRPNPIGAAVVPIERINNNSLVVRGLDCLDGTPILDIKPAIYREVPST